MVNKTKTVGGIAGVLAVKLAMKTGVDFVLMQKGEKMDDLISRQAAIDVAEDLIRNVYSVGRGGQREREVIRHVIDGIRQLPSAQPKKQASDEIYSMMKDYYFEHRNDHDESWQGGFAECMNLIPNAYERREDG